MDGRLQGQPGHPGDPGVLPGDPRHDGYGPIAAFLVELFPARIRYTSMSLPYHVGNGVFGGLVPAAGASIAAMTGIALSGLFYPMAIAAIGVVVSLSFLREPTTTSRSGTRSAAGRRRWCPTSPERAGTPGSCAEQRS